MLRRSFSIFKSMKIWRNCTGVSLGFAKNHHPIPVHPSLIGFRIRLEPVWRKHPKSRTFWTGWHNGFRVMNTAQWDAPLSLKFVYSGATSDKTYRMIFQASPKAKQSCLTRSYVTVHRWSVAHLDMLDFVDCWNLTRITPIWLDLRAFTCDFLAVP